MRPFLILFLLSVVACDETSEGVRRNYIDRHRESFIFEGTTKDYVLGVLRGVMEDEGHEVLPTEDGSTFKTTSIKDAGGRDENYTIRFVDLRWRKGFRVHLMHITRNPDGSVWSSYRDEKLEWELIQRADPDRAETILSKAAERADKVPPRVHARDPAPE